MPLTRSAILALADPDPETAEALNFSPQLPNNSSIDFWRTIETTRRPTILASLGPPPTGLTERDHQVPTRDGHNITVRSYSPDVAPAGGRSLIVMYHGGGFCLGGLETETPTCRAWALQLGAVVLNVEYRRAPEWVFPTPVKDAWDAFKWAATNASELGADPAAGFLVAGVSAGGNMASVVAHLARNEGVVPRLTGQYLSVPALIPADKVPEEYKEEYLSREQNRDSPLLPRTMVEMFETSHKADSDSPLFATFNDLSGHADLPPTYFQVCGADPYRDDAVIYERVLREDYKIPTKVDMYKGLPHMFWAMIPGLKQSAQWKADRVDGMRWLLEQ
ncbi:uncharacterized protein BDZ99DRAFT_571982 [Mytilinidion resinicola]|uniref:Alpha/beta hydrolase fold-3 domain-containing protein n=1 Tax=Mytilinidion resinicola TaxID=574789 RepID=A0A6A6YKX8_9PEZI|nr:uncharacterized protein BDZ99DRAFT_571982 [Mytilinidion resinicola]KAF2809188.1 hypothetical protein BDZ99DRAFT_571982 [Mytilinidion resinicola]